MKKIDRFGIFFLGVFISSFLPMNYFQTPSNPGPPLLQPFEEGDGGPGSRLAFDWLRLKSPISGEIPAEIKRGALEFAKMLPTTRVAPGRMEKSASAELKLEWKSRGPYNVGGRTRGLAIDVANPNIYIAGGVSGGIWRSEDGGDTWEKMTKSHQLHSVTTIAQDPREGYTHIWYAGTGEVRGNSAGASGAPYRGDGIYKSIDNGLTWELLASTTTGIPEMFDNYFNYNWRVLVHPKTGDVYTASFGSIYKSEDGGISWKQLLGDGQDRYTDLVLSDSGLMVACLGNEEGIGAVLRSEDGDTWTNITPTGFPSEYVRLVADISPSNDSIIYVIGNNGDDSFFWKYKYLSGDGSGNNGSWVDRTANLPDDYNTQNGYDIHVRVSPSDTNFVFFGGTNLYYTTDGMESATKRYKFGGYGHEDHHPDQHDVLLYKDKLHKVFSASDGGVHIMDDLTSWDKKWTSLNNGYLTTQFYTVTIDYSGALNNLVMGGTQDNGTWETTSTDLMKPWNDIYGGDGSFCSVIRSGNAYVVSSQRGNVLMKDYSNPFNWTYGSGKYANYSWGYLTPPDVDTDDVLFINPLLVDPIDDKILYYAGGTKLWRNNNIHLNDQNYKQADGGGSYTAIHWEEIDGVTTIGKISSLGASMNPGHRLYFGTSAGYIYRLDNSNTSKNPIDVSNNLRKGYVHSISVDAYNGDKVMVCLSNYESPSIFYTENGGATWNDVSGNLEVEPSGNGDGPSVRSVLVFPVKGGYKYFAGTSTGLYSTSTLDGINTIWVQESAEAIGNVVVDMVVGRPSDGYLAIATHGNGIYSAQLDAGDLAVNDPNLPTHFELTQNYPNPFNPSTTITFTLDVNGTVTLKVFDLMGRKISTLLNNVKKAGTHHIVWNGKDTFGNEMPSGLYLYSLESNGRVYTKKMQLLK